MLRKLWEMAVALLTISQDITCYRQEQKELNEKITNLTIIVHALAQEINNSKEQDRQHRENLLLEIENRLLKYEKALPAPKVMKRSAKKGSKR